MIQSHCICFFFFKQKTAYEMRISDWSSDVCSSDLLCFLLWTAITFSLFGFIIGLWANDWQKLQVIPLMIVTPLTFLGGAFYAKLGRASCRESVCLYV